MDKSIKHLVDAAKNNSLVIFVGAGISMNSKLPSWGELVGYFKEDLLLDIDFNDNLRIPQYYYNQFGHQKYIEKINIIFKKYSNAEPNELHDLIYQISPKHIITTNYDNLIEERMNAEISRYTVIASDEEIPYSVPGNYIIKMHGDLDHKNIVLKEDDYLDYNRNFPMISTLIKSIIMNNTLLFIGYSLNDSTFNSIFRLIKTYYAENSRVAYFYSHDDKDEIIVQYYRNKGFEVITNKSDETEIGKKTADFLKQIINDKLPKTKSDEDVWKYLHVFDNLNYIEGRKIIKYINYYEQIAQYKEIDNYILNKDVNFSLNKKHSDKDNVSFDSKFLNFLKNKSGLEYFEEIDLRNKILMENEELLEPYILYKDNKFKESRRKFREVANSAFKNGNYVNFLLAEFNIININKTFLFYGDAVDIERGVFKDIDFDQIYNQIYEVAENDMRLLLDFLKVEVFEYNYLFSKLHKVISLLDKIRKERLSSKGVGFSYNSNLYTIWREINNFNKFINLNCICFQGFSEYRTIINKYFEALLISHDIENITEKNIKYEASSKISRFHKEDLEVITPFLDSNMIEVYFDSLGIRQISVTKEAAVYLFDLIIDNFKKYNLLDINQRNKLNKYIILLYYTDYYDINMLLDILDAFVIDPTTMKYYSLIIKKFCKVIKDLGTVEKERLTKHINNLYKNSISDSFIKNDVFSNIRKLAYSKLNEDELRIISSELKEKLYSIKGSDIIIEFNDIVDDVVSLYGYFDEETRLLIDELIIKYEKLAFDKVDKNFIIMSNIMGIYKFEKYRDELLNHLIDIIKQEEKIGIKISPNPKEQAIRDLYNCYLSKFIDKNSILEKIDKNTTKGYCLEFDWEINGIKNKRILEKIIELYGLEYAKKNYILTDKDKKIFENLKDEFFELKFYK